MGDLDKKMEFLTGAVISSQVTLNFYEQLKYTSFYKHSLKKYLNLSIKELIKVEQKEYDKIFDACDVSTSHITENVLDVVNLISKNGFVDFITVGNIYRAWKKDPKSIEGITKKILKNE